MQTRGEKTNDRALVWQSEVARTIDRDAKRVYAGQWQRSHANREGEKKRGKTRRWKREREREGSVYARIQRSIARGMTIRVPGGLIVSTLSR